MEQNTNITHQLKLIVGPSLTLQHFTMNVGDHSMSVYNTVVDVGNERVGIYCELSLKWGLAMAIREQSNAH